MRHLLKPHPYPPSMLPQPVSAGCRDNTERVYFSFWLVCIEPRCWVYWASPSAFSPFGVNHPLVALAAESNRPTRLASAYSDIQKPHQHGVKQHATRRARGGRRFFRPTLSRHIAHAVVAGSAAVCGPSWASHYAFYSHAINYAF